MHVLRFFLIQRLTYVFSTCSHVYAVVCSLRLQTYFRPLFSPCVGRFPNLRPPSFPAVPQLLVTLACPYRHRRSIQSP